MTTRALAAVLVTPAFAETPEPARELTGDEKYRMLMEAGIFEFESSNSGLYLTRGVAAKTIALLLGLEENPAGAAELRDVHDHMANIGYIGAVYAAGVMEGTGDQMFEPSAELTVEQWAAVLVRALDLEVDPDARVEGEASGWAHRYVDAAIRAGLIPRMDSYTIPAEVGLLLNGSFEVYANTVSETGFGMNRAGQIGVSRMEIGLNAILDPSETVFTIVRVSGDGERMPVGVESIEWRDDGYHAG